MRTMYDVFHSRNRLGSSAHSNAGFNPYPSWYYLDLITPWVRQQCDLSVSEDKGLSNTNALSGLNHYQIFWPLHTVGWHRNLVNRV